jgi:hypothetical protein
VDTDVGFSLTCHKIFRHGADGFTFPPKEVMLRILIVLKNPSSWAKLQPVNLGPTASTITTRPPRVAAKKFKRY